MEAHAMVPSCLEKCEGALDVSAKEGAGIGDGVVVVTLGGEMDAGIGFREEAIDQVRIADVAMHEGHTLRIAACEILAVARIRKGVEHRDMSIGLVVEHPMHEIGADEPGSTGDDDILKLIGHTRNTPLFARTLIP